MLGSVNKRTFSLFDFSRTVFPRGRNGVPRSTSSNESILAVLIEDHMSNIVLKYQSNQKKSNQEISLLKSETLLFSIFDFRDSFYRGRKRGKKVEIFEKTIFTPLIVYNERCKV